MNYFMSVLVMNYFQSLLVSDWMDFCLIDDNFFGRLVSHTSLASFYFSCNNPVLCNHVGVCLQLGSADTWLLFGVGCLGVVSEDQLAGVVYIVV